MLARRLRTVLSLRIARVTTIIAGLLYLLLYLYALGDVAYSGEELVERAPAVDVVDDWAQRMFQRRVPFTFEPVAVIYVTRHLAYFFAPINVLLGTVLAVLLGLNAGFLAFAFKLPKVCGVRSAKGIFASLPGLLLGFACCAPTILLALGAVATSLTLGFIAVRTALYPLSLLGMLASLYLNLRRMRDQPDVRIGQLSR